MPALSLVPPWIISFSQLFYGTYGSNVKPEAKRAKEEVKSRIVKYVYDEKSTIESAWDMKGLEGANQIQVPQIRANPSVWQSSGVNRAYGRG